MQIIPKPGDQQSRSFVAELGIIRVAFSSVHTHFHSVRIFWGRKSSGSQWDRLDLPGLRCAKISNQVGIQIFIYFLSSEWLFEWFSSCSVVRQKATSYLLLCHSYNNSFLFFYIV